MPSVGADQQLLIEVRNDRDPFDAMTGPAAIPHLVADQPAKTMVKDSSEGAVLVILFAPSISHGGAVGF